MRSRRLLFAFAFAAGALLTGVVLFVLPRARVTLTTVVEPLSADVALELAAGGVATNEGEGVHHARHVVVEETVDGEYPVETTVETGERARGTAVVVNRTSTPQGIKSGTRLQSQTGVVLRTERDVIIQPNGRAPVAVRADSGGTAANLGKQRLVMPALGKESQRILFAEVTEPLNGGTDAPVRRLALGDLERGREALKGQAETRLNERLQAEFGGEGTWLALSGLSRVVVGEETPSVPVGTDTETFRLQAKVRAEALTVGVDTLRTTLRDLLRSKAGEGKDIAESPNLDDLRVEDVRWGELSAVLSLHAETTVIPALNLQSLKHQLGGRSASDAEAFLRALPGVRSASVILSPVWVKRVPNNVRNVHVAFERERKQ